MLNCKTTPGTCPHLERNDARCAARFNLDRLPDVYAQCFADYSACPIYHQLTISIEPARRPAALVHAG